MKPWDGLSRVKYATHLSRGPHEHCFMLIGIHGMPCHYCNQGSILLLVRRSGQAHSQDGFFLRGCGTSQKVDFLNLTPLTLLQKPHFWPIFLRPGKLQPGQTPHERPMSLRIASIKKPHFWPILWLKVDLLAVDPPLWAWVRTGKIPGEPVSFVIRWSSGLSIFDGGPVDFLEDLWITNLTNFYVMWVDTVKATVYL